MALENPHHGLGQALKCGGIKLLNGIPILPVHHYHSINDFSTDGVVLLYIVVSFY